VMDIPIDDQDASHADCLGASRCDGDMIDQTKTHRRVGQRVMSGGPNSAECIPILAACNAFHGIARSTHTQHGGVPGSGGYHRIGFDAPRILSTPLVDLLKIIVGVIQ